MYSKRYINSIYNQVFFKLAKVDLIKLSDEDIAKYTLKSQINEYEPATKKQKSECTQPLEAIEYTNSHKVGSIRCCDTSKLMEISLNSETQLIKKNDQENIEDKKTTENLQKSIENTENLCDKNLETIGCTNLLKVGTIRCCDTSKLMEISLNSETQLIKKNDQENIEDKKSTENLQKSVENIENLCDENLETKECTNLSKVGTIRCCDMRNLVKNSKLKKYFENIDLSSKIPKRSKNSEEKLKVIILINQTIQHPVQNKDKPISLIEFVYHKYFDCKFVQNNMIIIANILNIIRVYDAHHKAHMDSLGHIRIIQNSERYSSNFNVSMYLKNSNVLKSKLKKHFLAVLSEKIVDSDLELVVKIFALIIFNQLKVLSHQESNENIFKNLAHLPWDCLKDNELKIITILKSETFHSNCMDLIRVIENRWGYDPDITDRMPLLFMSSINHQQHIFQKIIDNVTSKNPNEHLALLVDIAALQCFNDLKLKL